VVSKERRRDDSLPVTEPTVVGGQSDGGEDAESLGFESRAKRRGEPCILKNAATQCDDLNAGVVAKIDHDGGGRRGDGFVKRRRELGDVDAATQCLAQRTE
jgi:hypothetical protein